MNGIEVGALVRVCAGAYIERIGPDEPEWPYHTAIPIRIGDELVHKPINLNSKRLYSALIRHPLPEPRVGIYLGWRWKATGVYYPGDYFEGFDYDPPYLRQDKRHKICCVHLLDVGEYWQPPFHCLPQDMELLIRY